MTDDVRSLLVEAIRMTVRETVAELVERRTGISLQQFTEDILDGGWEDD